MQESSPDELREGVLDRLVGQAGQRPQVAGVCALRRNGVEDDELGLGQRAAC